MADVQQRDGPSPGAEMGAEGGAPPDSVSEGVTPTRLLKMKESMANQCFEMAVKINMGKHKHRDTADVPTNLSKYEDQIEEARTSHFNSTLALKRLQVWNAITDKLVQAETDVETDDSLKELVNHNAKLCYKTRKILQETRELQDQVMELQKQRLEVKGHIQKKMQEITDLKTAKEQHGELYKAAVQKGEATLEKYQKLAIISQNVLRGILLAGKVNWRDDPKLRDIALGLENLPS